MGCGEGSRLREVWEAMKNKLPKITGFTIGPIGVEWEAKPSEKQNAQRVISFLEDRRVLYNAYELEVAGYCVQSVIEIRHFLTQVLTEVKNELGFAQHLRAMRFACRKFLDTIGDSADARDLDMFRGGLGAWKFALALGDLRTTIGLHLAIIANKFKLGIEGDLASIVPMFDDSDAT
jgi:hypothetical protein